MSLNIACRVKKRQRLLRLMMYQRMMIMMSLRRYRRKGETELLCLGMFSTNSALSAFIDGVSP